MEADLRTLLRKVVKDDIDQILFGQVIDRNKFNDQWYIAVEDVINDNIIQGVRILAGSGDSGITQLPKLATKDNEGNFTQESPCIIFRYGRNYIAGFFSEVEEMYMLSEENGGLIIIQDLVDRINELENVLTSLQSTLNTHVHSVSVDPITGQGATTTQNTQNTSIIPNTSKEDFENPNIKH